jgi:hypothetical protein
MKKPAPFVAVAFAALSVSCGALPGAFKDDLRFGTGIDYGAMKLTGEGTSFAAGPISFRVESAANFDGRFVRLYLNALEQKDFSACANADAHICLSAFNVSNPGTYEVKAYLVATVVDIGKETLVTSSSFTVH